METVTTQRNPSRRQIRLGGIRRQRHTCRMTRAALLTLALLALGADLVVAPALIDGQDRIDVVDGDTVDAGGTRYRLVGFDAPETYRAQCGSERQLGNRASDRLRGLIAEGAVLLTPVSCSCRPGTLEGTPSCNYGRRCAKLTAHGEDVAAIMIREGLARSYVCGATSCPHRPGWC